MIVKPRFHKWFVAAIFDWSVILIAICFTLWVNQWWIYPLLILVIGNRQHALSILGHDGGHGLVCSNRWFNDWLTRIFVMWPMNGSLDAYRDFHFAHHRNTGVTNLDPELIFKSKQREYNLPKKKWQIAFGFVLDLFGRPLLEIYRFVSTYLRPQKLRDVLGPFAFSCIIFYAFYSFGHLEIPIIWYVSMATSFWAFFRLRVWTEHQGTTDTDPHRISVNWWQRSFTPHNTWCHYEHHVWPQIPFWHLPRAREQLKEPSIIPLSKLWDSLLK